MTITAEELQWIQRRIQLEKTILLSQQQQPQHPPSILCDGDVFHTTRIPIPAAFAPHPVAASSRLHAMAMTPMVQSSLHMEHPDIHPYSWQPDIILPVGTMSTFPNTALTPQYAFAYHPTTEPTYITLLDPPPAIAAAPFLDHTQLTARSYVPGDVLSNIITQKIQEKLDRLNRSSMGFPTQQPSATSFRLDTPQLFINTGKDGPAARLTTHTSEITSPLHATSTGFEMRSELAVNLIRKKLNEINTEGSSLVGLPTMPVVEPRQRGVNTLIADPSVQNKITKKDDNSSNTNNMGSSITKLKSDGVAKKVPSKRKRHEGTIETNSHNMDIPCSRDSDCPTRQEDKLNNRMKSNDRLEKGYYDKRIEASKTELPNFQKLSHEIHDFIINCPDENIRYALQADNANNQMNREERRKVYEKYIQDVESRLDMYTQLELLAEKIQATRRTRGKRRICSESDWEIESGCETILLYLKNYRMLEDSMDRILSIGK